MGNLLGCPAGLSSGQTNLLAGACQNQSKGFASIRNFQQMNNPDQIRELQEIGPLIYEDFR
jgi:hypothetical protein